MRTSTLTVLMVLIFRMASAQHVLTQQDSMKMYFDEIKVATKTHEALWNMDLYGPILLVNPFTRQVYSNYPDSAGFLKQDGEIFAGTLPPQVSVANASISWSGVNWAMVIINFLSDQQKDRINLLAHELFHRAQPSLGFKVVDGDNSHLDQKEGRIYLRLELEALKKSVQSDNDSEMKRHLTNAMTFRKYRHKLYPGAETAENKLELNEGIAEYTGTIVSGRNRQEAIDRFVQKINELFINDATFIRTFAYRTTSIYGYLLHNLDAHWNQQVTINTNLADYFAKKFSLSLPDDPGAVIETIAPEYNWQSILADETAREEQRKRRKAEYMQKFVHQPHFEILFERRRVSFNSSNLMPLDEKGTVYPTMKAIDNWGILTVTQAGALMSPERDKVTITAPIGINGNVVNGDGWKLELNEGYTVVKDEATGNYQLVKK